MAAPDNTPDPQGDAGDSETSAPLFTVHSGNPTPIEFAAVTAVMTVMVEEAVATPPSAPIVASEWSRSQRTGRSPLTVGPGSWNRQTR